MKTMAFLLVLLALPLQADLARDIRSADGWVGYSVPIVEGRHTVCSWDNTMEIDHRWDNPASALLVMYEVEKGAIRSVRISSPECRATHQVRWLQNVSSGESLQLLRALIDADADISKKAVTALALHRDSEDELIRLARRHPSKSIRGTALFWVGQRAGTRAVETLRDAIENDPDGDVKGKAVFGIAQLPNDRSIPILIELLNTHRSRAVRKKAAFWLSQKDDPRALAAFEAILAK
jgi:HEAT repeat protein